MRWTACAGLLALAGLPVQAEEACIPGDGPLIEKLCYANDDPNPVYGHAVLGDTPEWSALRFYWGPDAPAGLAGSGPVTELKLETGIFEDIAPRLGQADGDALPEAVIVESQPGQGARIVVIDLSNDGLRGIPGPFIGTQFRWLAPVGMADLDGDGVTELAYIDRPHLAKTLRIFQIRDGRLQQITQSDDLTNHRIGEDFISGGLRDCGAGDGIEMVVATGNWQSVVAIRFVQGVLIQRILGPHKGPDSFRAALACEPLSL